MSLAEKKIRQLFEQYGSELHSFLVRRTGSIDRADDTLQDTFLAVVKYYRPDIENWRAWLYRIAVNASNKEYQKLKKTSSDSIDKDEFPGLADDRLEVDQKHQQLHEAILEFLAKHDPRMEQIYLLRLEFQMGLEEIGSILNIKQRTLSRLFQQMKEILKNNFEQQFLEL